MSFFLLLLFLLVHSWSKCLFVIQIKIYRMHIKWWRWFFRFIFTSKCIWPNFFFLLSIWNSIVQEQSKLFVALKKKKNNKPVLLSKAVFVDTCFYLTTISEVTKWFICFKMIVLQFKNISDAKQKLKGGNKSTNILSTLFSMFGVKFTY